MANLKIIWTTGLPFSSDCREKIGYQINSENWNIYTGSYWVNQTASVGEGNRPATAEEIAEHWQALHPKWTPEPGDRVIITQDHQDWCNKRGVIVGIHEGNSDYWRVGREDGTESVFRTDTQMILAPYEDSVKPVEATETPKPTSPESKHGFTIGDIVIPNCDNFKGRQCIVRAFGSSSVGVHCPLGASLGGHTLDGHCPDNTGRWYNPSSLELVSKVEPETISKPSTPSTPSIPIPKEGYVTVRLFTEEEFKSEGLWYTFDTFNSKGYPKGWNSEGEMNKYLGTYLQIREVDFRPDKSFTYSGWNFKNTDYEVIHEGVESKPEPKSGMITVRFFTEIEFKATDRWDTYASCPKGWVQAMNKYLGQTVDIKKSDIRIDGELNYNGWSFLVYDYEKLTPGYESKSSPKVETKLEPKEAEMKPQRFKVGDRVTYKSRSECYGGGYHYGGNNQYGYVGTIKEYLKYKPDNNCYKIMVTCKEGEYSMLESEFYEYDGPGLGVNIHKSTSGSIGIGTSSGTDFRILSSGTANAISLPLDTWGIHFHKTSSELKEEDVLAKYSQAPVTLQKKPKRKLITVSTY